MAYSIKQLAVLAGVTSRTLRYYDQIGLLSPSYTTASGYRMYEAEAVDKLQQILFFRELELSLDQIATILNQPAVDYLTLLAAHRDALVLKNQRLTALIATLDLTIAAQKGEQTMSDTQKFEAFKQQLITQNEAAHGQEIRETYGEERIDEANREMMKMSAEDYQKMTETEAALLGHLAHHADLEVPSEEAKTIFNLHKSWLTQAWHQKDYQPAAHRGIGEMYVADPRFSAYYDDKAGQGASRMLNRIIQHYA